MTSRAAALTLTLALALVVPTGAAARSPKEQAAGLLKEGSALYEQGDYAGALRKFEQAHGLYPSYKIVFNIATTLEYLGREAEAAQHFARFLALAGPTASLDTIRAARSSLAKLEPRLGRLKLSCSEEGATVLVDGHRRGSTPLAQAIYLAPGRRTLRVEKAGFTPASRELTLAAGQLEQLTLQLQPAPAAAAPPYPVQEPAAEVKEVPSPTPQDDGAQRRRTRSLWAYTTLGVGAALVVTASILYGVGASQGGEAHEAYTEATGRPGTSLAEIDLHRADVEAARDKILAGNILLGAGLVALGVSTYLFLTRPAERADEAFAGPLVVEGGGGVGLRGRF
jgi:tetratricopeptide (TPR) repeat protein